MRTTILIFFALTAACFAQNAGPEPAPWWMRVEQFQDLATRWLAAITLILTALVTAVFTVWALINSKLKEICARQDRASEEKRMLQQTVTDLAVKVDPPKTEP